MVPATVDNGTGSSPRGRGKLYKGEWTPDYDGLIPAWAGKTPYHAPRGPCRTAHPRVGGENRKDDQDKVMAAGSSPRGRGKLHTMNTANTRQRLIPAWAGKTLTWRSSVRYD